MSKYLSYKDVCLVPKYSELESRALADTSVDLCGFRFKLPCVPANMETVIDPKIAHFLSENGYFYIMHRFNIDVDFVRKAQDWKLISISCGVNYNQKEADLLGDAYVNNRRIDFITIDVAHGDHLKVKQKIEWLKQVFPKTKIIAGNIATPQAARHLVKWGADIIKAGIAGGSICSTRYQTGFHIPMFSCIKNIDYDFRPATYSFYVGSNPHGIPNRAGITNQINTPIIADGSISNIGDIAKAINAGATMVMCGKLFAECIDSPAKTVNGKKQYYGSTSFEAKKTNSHIEGHLLEMDFGVTVQERLKEIEMALQSSISYAGGNKIEDLRKVDYIEVN